MSLKRSNRQAMALKQILKRCSSFAKNQDEVCQDVPRGYFVVYVGDNRTRFIVPIAWLAHLQFKALLRQAEEEYGFCHELGITIPCDENDFLAVVTSLESS